MAWGMKAMADTGNADAACRSAGVRVYLRVVLSMNSDFSARSRMP